MPYIWPWGIFARARVGRHFHLLGGSFVVSLGWLTTFGFCSILNRPLLELFGFQVFDLGLSVLIDANSESFHAEHGEYWMCQGAPECPRS